MVTLNFPSTIFLASAESEVLITSWATATAGRSLPSSFTKPEITASVLVGFLNIRRSASTVVLAESLKVLDGSLIAVTTSALVANMD